MSLKILSTKFENNMLIVHTNNSDRPDFVYSDDKFSSKTALMSEIMKSIAFESKRKKLKKDKRDKLEAEL